MNIDTKQSIEIVFLDIANEWQKGNFKEVNEALSYFRKIEATRAAFNTYVGNEETTERWLQYIEDYFKNT